MKEENITCDFCNKKKWAFIDVDTEKSVFSKRFRVCVDCFKNEDIEELVGKAMEKDANQNIAHHQKQIDEIKMRLQNTQNGK